MMILLNIILLLIDCDAWTPPQETQALATFFSELGGASWDINRGWDVLLSCLLSSEGNATIDPCAPPAWYGVQCTTSLDNISHVVGLSLSGNNLQGVLPSLKDLELLADFEISANEVQGDVSTMCGLSNLQILALDENSLTGTIPRCLLSLSSLRVLYLDYNPLVGSTPHELCALSNLEQLTFRGCQLTGSIPNCIANLEALRILDYTSITPQGITPGIQSLSGTLPASLCQLRYLEKLLLQHTQGIGGSVPGCLGMNQTSLTTLALEDNQLTGTIPDSLCSAGNLGSLLLFKNLIVSTIPACIGNLQSLHSLEIQLTQISGRIPSDICKLSRLVNLVLYETNLSGNLNDCIGESMPLLRVIEFQHTNIGGTVPQSLCHLKGLSALVLNSMNLVGTIPSCLGNASNLYLFEIGSNSLEGVFDEAFCDLKKLQIFNIENTSIGGSLPPCIGNLMSLTDFEVQHTDLSGTLPENMCLLTKLQYLYIHDTSIHGSIPECMGTSFPDLTALLLHDNHFSGKIPQEWKLPSLSSIVLSNNKGLGGTLPPSLFHQKGFVDSNDNISLVNPRMLSVIVEGTNLRGTIDAACFTSQLQVLKLSGSAISGSLPECITELKHLTVLRVAHNNLGGRIPSMMANMTALSILDLSSNKFRGSLDSSFGELSSQLQTTKLNLNRLSCDLPSSVRHWTTAANISDFELLHGNLFSCGGREGGFFSRLFALAMVDAEGLQDANRKEFTSYSCGGSSDVLPILSLLVVALPMLFFLACSGQVRCLWSRGDSKTSFGSIEVTNLAIGIITSSLTASLLMFIMVTAVATPQYECEYTSVVSLANKNGKSSFLSAGVGVAVVSGLFACLSPWWRRFLPTGLFSKQECQEIEETRDTEDSALQSECSDGVVLSTEAQQGDLETVETGAGVLALRVLKLSLLAILVTAFTAGPNFAYTLIVLSNSIPYKFKVLSVVAITLTKVVLTTLVVPTVSRLSVNEIIPAAYPAARFRLRMAISTTLAALSLLAAPVVIVFLTDERCAYYYLYPQKAETTEIDIPYCAVKTIDSEACESYAATTVESTYRPEFEYSGELCTSAFLDTYSTIFLTSILFSALVPAVTEIGLVPRIMPWCHSHNETSFVARVVYKVLRSATWNVTPILVNAGNISVPQMSRVQYMLHRVAERSFVQLVSILLVALTVGIAAPMVGASCAVAALVLCYHHNVVVDQLASLAVLTEQSDRRSDDYLPLPNQDQAEKGVEPRTSLLQSSLKKSPVRQVPSSCAAIVGITTLVFWIGGVFRFLFVPIAGIAALSTCLSLALLLGVTAAIQNSRKGDSCNDEGDEGFTKDRASSFTSNVSAATSRGLMLEPLLEDDAEDDNDIEGGMFELDQGQVSDSWAPMPHDKEAVDLPRQDGDPDHVRCSSDSNEDKLLSSETTTATITTTTPAGGEVDKEKSTSNNGTLKEAEAEEKKVLGTH